MSGIILLDNGKTSYTASTATTPSTLVPGGVPKRKIGVLKLSDSYCRPNYFTSLVENPDGTWTAIGSRKMGFLNFELVREWDAYGALNTWDWDRDAVVYGPQTIHLEGEAKGIITTQASTRLAALGMLLDAFDTEEREEEHLKRVGKELQELNRLGGEIDDELAKKIRKWRKKRDERGTV